jgi:thiopeptide-type bacteriocin biosynthesis protein
VAHGPGFVAAEAAILRVPVLPRGRGHLLLGLLDDPRAADQRPDAALSLEFIEGVLSDPVIREAVQVSSDSLARTLAAVQAQAAPDPKKAWRAALSLARYVSRMACRPTPFGLMAGVAPVRLLDTDGDAVTKLRDAHTKFVRPDLGWLLPLVRRWEADPAVLPALQVVANDLCYLRGDRLVLPFVISTADEQGARDERELSIRWGAVTQACVQAAAEPVRYDDLVGRLVESFGEPAAVAGLVRQLVETDVLLTSLRPPPDEPDPLGHVIRQLPSGPDGPVGDLERVRDEIGEYRATAPGAGGPGWRRLCATIDELAGHDRRVQVDLRLDVDAELPRVVAAEFEQAADVTCRLAEVKPALPHLNAYHLAFLERYGLDRLVPVMELLDCDRGMGPPAGYQVPSGHRRLPDKLPENEDRARVLAELVQEASWSRQREVVLDDGLVERLATAQDSSPPRWLELCGHVLAESMAAVNAGDFRLALSVMSGFSDVGAGSGRFLYAVDELTAPLAALITRAVTEPGDGRAARTPAQIGLVPTQARTGNVAQAARVLPHIIAPGSFPHHRDGIRQHPVSDLAVGADQHRLYVVSLRDGIELTPMLLNAVNRRIASNVSRLLHEIGAAQTAVWVPWQWGSAGLAPYLPRVRHGRTILSSATWRPSAELRDRKLAWPRWQRSLADWRDRWQVPDVVQCVVADNRIELDLRRLGDQRILQGELTGTPWTYVMELPGGDESGTGWLGGHASEVIVPLRRRTQGTRSAAVRRGPGPSGDLVSAPSHPRHLLGGEWLYLLLYTSHRGQEEVLARELPVLLDQLDGAVDRWFFIRYADPEPHLRLRLHGAPRALLETVIPLVNSWTNRLLDDGLAWRMASDTYVPETGRYGDGDLLVAAEEAFHADSDCVVTQARLRYAGLLDLPTEMLAAANFIDMARRLRPDTGPSWLLRAYDKGPQHGAFQRQRARALELLDPAGRWEDLARLDGGRQLVEAWQRRAPALGRYAALLDARRPSATGAGHGAPFVDLLHLHHNRLVGTDRDNESRARAIARGVVAAHSDRARHHRQEATSR